MDWTPDPGLLIVLLVPSGYLVNLFSPKRLFTYGMLFGSTVTIFMPLLMQLVGWKGACVGRIAVGLGEAFINVCAYELLSKWAPPQELSRMCECDSLCDYDVRLHSLI